MVWLHEQAVCLWILLTAGKNVGKLLILLVGVVGVTSCDLTAGRLHIQGLAWVAVGSKVKWFSM